MKIAHVTSILSRRGAGVRNVVESLARAQQDQGHEIKVFGLSDPEYASGEDKDWAGLDTSAFRTIGPKSIGFCPTLSRALKKWGPEIVHLHGLWTYPSSVVARWHHITGKPYIVSVHGMLSEVAMGYSSTKKRVSRVLFQDRCFNTAAALHATNEAELAEIRLFGYQGPIAIFPNGVNALDIPRLPDRGAARTALTLGRLHHLKGLDILIDVWAELEPYFPNWSLRIIGPDEKGYGETLKERIVEKCLSRCSVEHPVFGIDKDVAIASADLFVLPSRSENFALTVAESLMMEVPVISSQNAPWHDLEKENSGLWVKADKEEFTKAMTFMMNLPDEQRRKMGQNGRLWMLRDFSWGAVARRADVIYAWAVGCGPRTEDVHLVQVRPSS